MKVVVLGCSGMLGSMVLDWLSRDRDLELAGTVRDAEVLKKVQERSPGVEWHSLDAGECTLADILKVLDGASWVINCIGVIKPYIHDDNAVEVEKALRVNSVFPHLLAHAATQSGARVLQIATDCVYSGVKGKYSENDKHDALDVYGKTKSLGEAFSEKINHLRCSIIGPEPKSHVSLLDWFLGQPNQNAVSGYVNHEWNGVTTLHFARLCHGIIKEGVSLTHLQHIIPQSSVSKAALLGMFARYYQREDVTINPSQAEIVIDRTLSTNDEDTNRRVWSAAGYAEPPSIERMVEELATFDYRFAAL